EMRRSPKTGELQPVYVTPRPPSDRRSAQGESKLERARRGRLCRSATKSSTDGPPCRELEFGEQSWGGGCRTRAVASGWLKNSGTRPHERAFVWHAPDAARAAHPSLVLHRQLATPPSASAYDRAVVPVVPGGRPRPAGDRRRPCRAAFGRLHRVLLCAECHNRLDRTNSPRAPVREDGTFQLRRSVAR